MYALGLDVGTTTICGVLLDYEKKQMLASKTYPNPGFFPTEDPLKKMQDPNGIWNIVQQIYTELSEEYAMPDCIGISGQMHGILYVDQNGEAVSPLYIWQDQQSSNLYPDSLESYSMRLSRLTGYPVSDGYGLATHYYLSVNHMIPEEAAHFCSIGDFIAMKLCGNTQPCMHPTNAGSFGVFSLSMGDFDYEALQKAGITKELFPTVSGDFATVGKTEQGAVVAVSIGDNQASFLGSVQDTEHSLLVNVGTGSQISLLGRKADPQLAGLSGSVEARPFLGEYCLLAGSSLCGGRAYAALIDFFRQIAALAGKTDWTSVYDDVSALLRSPLTGEPLRISTLFNGSRSHPEDRGGVQNLSLENFTPAQFAAGTLRGIANELYDMYQQMPHDENIPFQLVASGNGVRRNPYLQQVFAEIFDSRLQIPAHQEEASFGAAIYALTASGLVSDLKEAAELIHYTTAE